MFNDRRLHYASALTALLVLACQSQSCGPTAKSPVAPPAPQRAAPPRGAPALPLPAATMVLDFAGTTGSPSSAIATNLSEFADWSAEWSMIDAFRQSRDWISGRDEAWSDETKLDLDANGWVKSLKPGQIARTLLFWGEAPYPSGTYVVRYEGKGKFYYFHNGEILSRSPGRDVIRLNSKEGGVGIFITETDPTDYIRKIRVLPDGGACTNDPTSWCHRDAECGGGTCQMFEQHHEQLIFHPLFLKTLTPYSGVRFMNWMKTNGSEQSKWEDRPKVDDPRWTTKGVPVEIMVGLANRMKLDPWFNMPHMADDDYVRKFAEYVEQHLDPERKAYIEHSNEVWNGSFPQHEYAAQQADKVRAHDKSALSGEASLPRGDDARFETKMKWHALRSTQIFQIWSDVFGADAKKRLIRVMGSWAAVPEVSERLLGYFDAHKVTDALAIAPYFGPDLKPETSVDEAFHTFLPREIDEIMRARVEASAAIAQKFGVDLIAYEGGQSLVAFGEASRDPHLNALYDQINRDPRMRDMYLRYLDMWKAAGGHMFFHFESVEGYGPFGRWGAREHMMQPVEQAPKLLGLLEWSRKNPRWW